MWVFKPTLKESIKKVYSSSPIHPLSLHYQYTQQASVLWNFMYILVLL